MIAKPISSNSKKAALGARLARVRADADKTQDAFAKSIGLSPRAYHYYERGQRSIPIEAIDLIGEIYEVDMNWLMRGLDKGDLADVSTEIKEFAIELHRYVQESGAKVKPESFGAIVTRWYQAVREGKKILPDDVHIWVDLVRIDT